MERHPRGLVRNQDRLALCVDVELAGNQVFRQVGRVGVSLDQVHLFDGLLLLGSLDLATVVADFELLLPFSVKLHLVLLAVLSLGLGSLLLVSFGAQAGALDH